MAARKGIKTKLLAHFLAGERLTGREIEKLYIQYGGSEDSKRPGHISWDSLCRAISSLPLKRVQKKGGFENRSLMRDTFMLCDEQYAKDLEHERQKKVQKNIWGALLDQAVQ